MAVRLVPVANYEQLSQEGADWLITHLTAAPSSLLVLPTGRTPLGMYHVLVERTRAGRSLFGSARLVQLDEYIGIARDDPRSLYGWLEKVLVQPVGFDLNSVFRFDSEATDLECEAVRIERILSGQGGIDLLVLGLGTNAHLGFNEPGSRFDSRTRAVNLSAASIASNARYWGGTQHVPCCQAFTLGLQTLATARRTLLLVSGVHKAGALARVLEGPIDEQVPATVLRRLTGVTVIADAEAASRLTAATIERLSARPV